MRPVEGTILTVVRSIAEALESLDDPSLVTLLEHGAGRASAAVASTPDLLPVLRDAGVVDAGGKGLTLLLDAFLEVVDGRPIPEPELVDTPLAVAAHLSGEDDVSGLRYEVMYLLDAPDTTISGFREALGRRSATRSSSSAATASGTVTCTPTTSAPRSKRESTRADRTRSASPT